MGWPPGTLTVSSASSVTGGRVHGYSDRINHALAFAAKHHDQQVRKGLRAPYRTASANIGIILTRYGRGEPVVAGGILHDVIEDHLRDGSSRLVLDQRIGEKFGLEVLELVLAVAQRRFDDEGIELSADERRSDCLARLAGSQEDSRWICAADKLHHAATLAADLRRTVDPGSIRVREGSGHAATVGWLRAVATGLAAVGFDSPIVLELVAAVQELEARDMLSGGP